MRGCRWSRKEICSQKELTTVFGDLGTCLRMISISSIGIPAWSYPEYIVESSWRHAIDPSFLLGGVFSSLLRFLLLLLLLFLLFSSPSISPFSSPATSTSTFSVILFYLFYLYCWVLRIRSLLTLGVHFLMFWLDFVWLGGCLRARCCYYVEKSNRAPCSFVPSQGRNSLVFPFMLSCTLFSPATPMSLPTWFIA